MPRDETADRLADVADRATPVLTAMHRHDEQLPDRVDEPREREIAESAPPGEGSVQRVHSRVAGDEDLAIVHAFGQEIGACLIRRSEVE